MRRMGLLNKIFKRGDAQTTQYQESDLEPGEGSKNAPRREMVHVVLRDTMRQHGIPSDWIDCGILSVVNENATTGMHVHLIVRQGHDRMLAYVPAFQSAFMTGITKFEPRASDWLHSLSWQFEGMAARAWEPIADFRVASGAAPLGAAAASPAADGEHDDIEEDLKALYAIRDAAMKGETKPPPGHSDFQPTQPGL
jgi:hypothetical protein